MEIQSINSQQNFQGNLRFIDYQKTGNTISTNIKKYIPNLADKDLQVTVAEIYRKPYDVFISKSKDLNGFYEVIANVKPENVLHKGIHHHTITPVLLNENNPDRLFNTVAEAMKKYEKSPDYKKDITPDNIFVMLYKFIFRKG